MKNKYGKIIILIAIILFVFNVKANNINKDVSSKLVSNDDIEKGIYYIITKAAGYNRNIFSSAFNSSGSSHDYSGSSLSSGGGGSSSSSGGSSAGGSSGGGFR